MFADNRANVVDRRFNLINIIELLELLYTSALIVLSHNDRRVHALIVNTIRDPESQTPLLQGPGSASLI